MNLLTPFLLLAFLTGLTTSLPAAPFITTTLNTTTPLSALANPLTCQTKPTSPLISAIHANANAMIAVYPSDKLCIQTRTDWGLDTCDLKSAYNEAELLVCAKKGKNVRCHSVAWAAKHIANNCKQWSTQAWGGDWVAEGIYWFAEAKVNVVVKRREW